MAIKQKDIITSIEKVVQFHSPIYSPIEDREERLHLASTNGYVYQLSGEEVATVYNTSGQPTGLAFDPEAGSYIADMAHQAILSQGLVGLKAEKFEVIKDYEGTPLLGPNSLIINKDGNSLFFTDSGPFGHTTTANPRGSVFTVDLESCIIKPLIHELLAYPCGLALSPDEAALYVAETCKNRVLRLIQYPAGVFHSSTFFQFAGRLGPTALAIHYRNYVFVAHYDFPECSKDGVIVVISEKGELVAEIVIPEAPEITGLQFAASDGDVLYVTEKTHNCLYKLTVNIK
eukprot:TRINITY_DN7959_c0_g1_i12.p1 TRINITY_DN7959_c0_g1~~TRINITY_DN7959_c0_g1_i12.p1  ORF type:complete len:288 (-),score=72.88 TRINITY_DN7959_c0_g1_i12:113-976(-)